MDSLLVSNFKYNYFKNNTYGDIHLTQIGYQKYLPGNKGGVYYKDCYVLHVVLNGKGYYRVGGKEYDLSANKAFLLPPTQRVEYASDSKDMLEYIWIGLHGSDADDFFKSAGFTEKNYVVSLKSTEELEQIMLKMLTHNIGDTPDFFLLGKMYLFLDMFLKNLVAYCGDEIIYCKDKCSDAIKYIRENYSDDVSVEKICKEIGVERTGLYKKFKEKFDMSPKRYIIEYKLSIAENMIGNTSMSFTEICRECGFNDYSHFCKRFKKRYGKSPRVYREFKQNNRK